MQSTVDVDKQEDEGETGDVQVVVWRDLFAKPRRGSGARWMRSPRRVSRWDGTKNLIVTDLSAVRASETMPPSHGRH